MTIDEILEKGAALRMTEERCKTSDYAEFVIDSDALSDWQSLFESLFGSPVSAKGEQPSDELLELTREHGGLWGDQVLYKIDREGVARVIVMLWPWESELFTTVKIAQIV